MTNPVLSRPRYVAPPDAATVSLPFHTDLEEAVEEMTAVSGMVIVDGPSGSGKTYGTQRACAATGVSTVTLRLGPRPGTAKVVRAIFAQLTGTAPPRMADTTERQVEELLAEQSRILVVDEAQKLGRDGVDQLVHLLEHPQAQFTLVLVGARLLQRLADHEEFLGRAGRTVLFQRLRDDALVEYLTAYHPLLARTAPDLLRHIDNRRFRGNLRRWAQFTHAAYNRVDDPSTDSIDSAVAEAAVRAVLGEEL